VNLKSGKAMAIKMPRSVLPRADEVIEKSRCPRGISDRQSTREESSPTRRMYVAAWRIRFLKFWIEGPSNVAGASESISRSAMTSVPDDAALVSRCLDGDAAAWDALVRRYQRLVYAIALRASLDEHGAADVFQTVFARLVQFLPRISEPAKLQAWIVTTAKREVLLLRRRADRTVPMTVPGDDVSAGPPGWEIADDSPLPDEALDELQQLAQVRLALERLDKRCRRLLLELFGDNEKVAYDNVALRLGIPRGSIGPTRSRCLAKLRSSLL
jgi:RNA polymerase sigma factor (sigma-70 family)